MMISLEKRFNFTMDDLDVRAPMYDHFCSLIAAQRDQSLPGCSGALLGRKLSISGLPKSTEYDRGSDMELWVLHLPDASQA